MCNLHYDDFVVGEIYEFGDVEITKKEIVEFGRQYDPLPFHTDDAAGAETPFDGVITSGLQTFALSQRQIVDNLYGNARILGSVGFEDVSFPNPVGPGDRLSTTLEVLKKRPSKSDPTRGLVALERTVRNQHDSVVLRAVNNVLFERKTSN
ncbi:MaoC/PaaZ C-terminal domain-containing protein [Halalkalicoccus sp. NIPERK01]|uniref:MaoC/PaaZ C-terminal domain-containing protein n=1 Tax=Halalkalicoccus sp. NIPERK01 TaxID=3053469 RepID=UPI00256EE00B|nr:MaoC/PaaZ C-terminal domain-containing protein [Halalkalicoccus sp. NIPERK01]MDL5363817.1 MaoC/PaaZ C-terminal domain-containing protein [Halalkalicoccus sp. NIPERK01]